MTARLGVVRLAAALAGAALIVACPARAAFPGENGKIAFTADPGDRVDIATMNADGSGQTSLTNFTLPNAGQFPAWSPDGSKIAFSFYNGTADSEVFAMGANGSGRVNLTRNPAADDFAAWSPRGSEIAFDRGSGIAVMNADGSGQHPLLADSNTPAWSPDGTKIAFNRDSHLFVANADGSAATDLVDGIDPSWSPDGHKIAFTTGRDGNPEIYAMNADGSGQTRLTQNAALDAQPAWSPDGKKIAFISNRDGPDDDVFTMNADGSAPVDLTNNATNDFQPDWQPIPSCSDSDAADTDGDGLCDSWETAGIDADDDGHVDLKLYDADGNGSISDDEQAAPDHKDLFVEIDRMNGEPSNQGAIDDVVDAFAAAPVLNPDATAGIRLHVVPGDIVPQSPAVAFTPCTRPAQGGEADFDQLKDRFFGTAAERAGPAAVLKAKRLAFRYVVWAHALAGKGGTSGCSELPGNDSVITLGLWKSTRDEQAGTFMHEFGHALGLHHGGLDDDNCKPNYLSVMNYTFQIDDAPILGRPLDYSRAALPTLFESVLNEPAGLGGPPGQFSAFGPVPQNIIFTDQPVDWNLDGDMTDVGVQANLDFNPAFNCSGAGTTLVSADDWANLVYDFRSSPDFADGIHTTSQSVDEITHEQAVANSPDSDGDGVPDFEDDCVCATPPPCADAKPPEATVRAARARHAKLRLFGTAADSTQCAGAQGAVERVEAAIGKRVGKRCRFLNRHGKLGHKRSCDKPAFLAAHGTAAWKLKIKHPPAGRYRTEARASDAAGNVGPVARLRLSIR